jgi:hypothetical protein
MPQNEVGPDMARTMVEDGHGVKPLAAAFQAPWPQNRGGRRPVAEGSPPRLESTTLPVQSVHRFR